MTLHPGERSKIWAGLMVPDFMAAAEEHLRLNVTAPTTLCRDY